MIRSPIMFIKKYIYEVASKWKCDIKRTSRTRMHYVKASILFRVCYFLSACSIFLLIINAHQ
ncbi:uncharacterized protein B0P05DRAFT_542200 [Gilbertella persicaria]|uniref:uncharacterized protein n=1 Tax=Gilbertella persicaria TaxID=101096 RepID=UPI002220E0E3|nr:uncharacterized protein B0P05DRAFT_542200 [Gilbertella persicaria]KAI8079062.1 hypothetical protein B0P05DRAFT_542200 [Gilbertella persicaria]